jgi:hypothetical protein
MYKLDLLLEQVSLEHVSECEETDPRIIAMC